MAEKTKTKTEREHKAKTKKHLRAITTHKADDGSFVHEHHYADENGQSMPPTYGGVSSNLEDLQQHMADHFGPGDEQQAGADQGADQGGEAGGGPAAGAPSPMQGQ